MKKLLLAIIILSFPLLFGCGQEGLFTGTPATIVITPATATMLSYSTWEFRAKVYDSNGNEIFFNPTWTVIPWELGEVTEYGIKDNRPYAVFKPTGEGTVELRCFASDIWDSSVITAYAGTIEVITVSPSPITMTKGETITFTATAEDTDGNVITYFIPTWQVTAGLLSIESTYDNMADIKAIGAGFGTVEAIFQGMAGTAEVEVTGITVEATINADRSTYVDASNDVNLSGQAYIGVGYDSAASNGTWEALLSFDVSSISNTASVTSAKIKFYVISRSDVFDIALYETTSAWVEGTVKESTKPTSGAPVVGDASVPEGGNYITITLNAAGEALVESWISGAGTNNGFYLKKEYPDNIQEETATLSSRNDSEIKKPKLIIEYID
jgi:hypothetical protein